MNDNVRALLSKGKRFLERFSYGDVSLAASVYSKDVEWDRFYQRFEQRFRGSYDLIKQRLKDRYFNRLHELIKKSKAFDGGHFIDLGCGRGELLELASSLGYRVTGVEQLGQACQELREQGYCAVESDLLKYLSAQEAESAVCISLLHVVEHCPPSYNWQVLGQAYRVLKPGGALLIETPSLFSLWAAHRQFYLDPTHEKPVHPELLTFMAEDCGFSKIEVLEFDEVKGDFRAQLVEAGRGKLVEEFRKLEHWLYGPMDMAIWAIK